MGVQIHPAPTLMPVIEEEAGPLTDEMWQAIESLRPGRVAYIHAPLRAGKVFESICDVRTRRREDRADA